MWYYAHSKQDAARHTSWKRLWKVLVPLTPLSRGMSHSCFHVIFETVKAARFADPFAEHNKFFKSFFNSSCLFSSIIWVAFSGSFKHLAKTLIPRVASSILHCCTIEQLYIYHCETFRLLQPYFTYLSCMCIVYTSWSSRNASKQVFWRPWNTSLLFRTLIN